MKRKPTLTLAFLATTVPFAATALDLKPMQAYTVQLNEQTAVIYYTEVNGKYEVVTTVASNDGSGVPTRFIATLASGERYTLSFADSAKTIIDMVGTESLVSIQNRSTELYTAVD